MTAVPLIDLTPWYSGNAAARRQVATDLDRGLCEVGFLLVTGHPLPAGLAERVRREVRRFFALPTAVKAELACFPGGRGWVPPGVLADPDADQPGSPPDLREWLSFGPEEVPQRVVGTAEEEWFGPNSWPVETPALAPAATAFASACADLVDDLLRICALALDLDDDWFVSRCAAGPWRTDLTWYPARAVVRPVLPGQLREARHTDVGTLTLADRQPGGGGLQVQTLDGEWADPAHVPGALTVNAGDLLSRWTGDRWRSAPHRVLPPPAELPTEELLSLEFSREADPLAVVETLPTAAAGPTRYDPVTVGHFLRGRRGSVAIG